MAPITNENPTGIETFDHSRISSLPEYAAVSRALDRLVKAGRPRRGRDRRPGREVADRAADRVGAAVHTENCEKCADRDVVEPGSAPDGAEVRDGWVDGRYRVPRVRHPLDMRYAVDVPQF